MAIKTIEEFRTEATTEINAKKTENGGDGMFAQVNNERREFTDAEYDQAIEDLAQSKLDEQDNGYKRARQGEYPALPEQFDLLYKDMLADKGDKNGEWFKAIKKVKDDNPKPS
tara:strand:- start:4888 stop:5226 length:339 start_codon:yes stop_codon:yes gene_type:complete